MTVVVSQWAMASPVVSVMESPVVSVYLSVKGLPAVSELGFRWVLVYHLVWEWLQQESVLVFQSV